ncbi:alpha-amylase [Galdieria sulphuraria]|uniref:Alpha-amylase n=1 Tax=Galdieria sulphuraria TaxID=130081 RepID=M2XK05_GALSU|nr:alpha-amylase [Galdieria sulphuraria]EME30457.1 alpha-amylase [Galdieria sulphuraria]|eukprot:XP_005706977.1 alpha-amylase [Galdieria sulphuraria]
MKAGIETATQNELENIRSEWGTETSQFLVSSSSQNAPLQSRGTWSLFGRTYGKKACFVLLFGSICLIILLSFLFGHKQESQDQSTEDTSYPSSSDQSDNSMDDVDKLGSIYHNSRDIVYRSPVGAVPVGTIVSLVVSTQQDYIRYGYIRLWNHRDSKENRVDLSFVESKEGRDFWMGKVNTSIQEAWCYDKRGQDCTKGGESGNLFWYRFIVGTQHGNILYYEQMEDLLGGFGQAYENSLDRSWVITAYRNDFSTPRWLQDAIFYHIFVDRFRNGNDSNDPQPGNFYYEKPIFIHSSWNEPLITMTDEQLSQGLASLEFYGGDLEGILEKLDYIRSLGVNVLYLSPIFESPSNHGYDTIDYTKVAEKFGGIVAFRRLISSAKAQGFRIILDGVFNHVSSESIYFDRYNRWNGGACLNASSPYRNWFEFLPAVDGPCIYSKDKDTANFKSWFGIDTLPVLKSSLPSVRNFIWKKGGNESIATRWLLEGIDGWRLDVANEIDPGLDEPENGYWSGFRSQLLELSPETYIVGEYWGDSLPWIVGNAWDASMNYPLGNTIIGFWLDTSFSDTNHKLGWNPGPIEPLSPSRLDRHIQSFLEKYPPMVIPAMMNILGSHDTNRLLFMLDPNTSQMNPNLYNHPEYAWDIAIRRLIAAISLQMSLPGAPSLFYGDEVGLVGIPRIMDDTWQSDPANRMPFPWLDEKVNSEPYYLHLKSQEAMQAISNRIKLAIQARNAHSSLRNGSFHTVSINDSEGIYCFLRHDAITGDCALVALRKTDSSGTIPFHVNTVRQELPCILPKQKWKNVLHSEPQIIEVDDEGTLRLTLESVSVSIFVKV